MSQEGVRQALLQSLSVLSLHRKLLASPCPSTFLAAGKREHVDLQTKVTSARAVSFLDDNSESRDTHVLPESCRTLVDVLAAHPWFSATGL
jgi:hypothetical protein